MTAEEVLRKLETIETLKKSCSRSMTEARREIRLQECRYNSAAYQWNMLEEQEIELKALMKYFDLAKPEALCA